MKILTTSEEKKLLIAKLLKTKKISFEQSLILLMEEYVPQPPIQPWVPSTPLDPLYPSLLPTLPINTCEYIYATCSNSN